MAEKTLKQKIRLKEVPMYCKELVYPNIGVVYSFEEIRARRPQYQSTPSSRDECDMDLTEACLTNITINVPVVCSMEKKMYLMQQDKPIKNDQDHKEGIAGGGIMAPKDRVLDVEGQSIAKAIDNLSISDIRDKENLLPPPVLTYHFSPSISDDFSVSSQKGLPPSMITKLSFSEADSISSFQEMKKSGHVVHLQKEADCTQKAGDQRVALGSIVQKEKSKRDMESFSIYNEPSIDSSQRAGDQRVALGSIVQKEKSKRDMESFSIYNEPSIDSSQRAGDQRVALGSIVQKEKSKRDMESFSIYNEPSIDSSQRAGDQRVALGSIVQKEKSKRDMESFSIYNEPSIDSSQRAGDQRVALGSIVQKEKSKRDMESFSIYNEPSINSSQRAGDQRVALGSIVQKEKSKRDMESFSIYNEPSINSSQRAGDQRVALGSIVQKEKSKRDMESFSIYNEPSIDSSQRAGDQRVALGSIVQKEKSKRDMESFSIYNEPSINSSQRAGDQRVALGSIVQKEKSKRDMESFSIYNEPSIDSSQRAGDQRVALGSIVQKEKSKRDMESFSIYNEPSIDSSKTGKPEVLPVKHLKFPAPRTNPASETHPPISDVSPNDINMGPVVNDTIADATLFSGTFYDPTSTPTGSKRIGPIFDLTAIQPEPLAFPNDQQHPFKQPYHHHAMAPPTTTHWKQQCPVKLDTIQEESRSAYTTSSSASSVAIACCISNSSKSSNFSHHSHQHEEDPELHELQKAGLMNSKFHVDPFTAEIIDFMLQSLPILSTPINRSSSSCPKMTSNNSITICHSSYAVIKKLATGGFASVYTAKKEDNTRKALKIQNPPYLWEVAITEELHKRLQANDLMIFSPCFMNVNSLQIFTNASVIVYDYYPHGTLLDLINSYRTSQRNLSEVSLLYFSIELMYLVDALHSCGVIHADIKPDNIMLRDIRKFSNGDLKSKRGHGLCLVDFGRSIDVQCFPRGTQFVGSCNTDAFQCTQMVQGDPWMWQADLYGIAGTIHVLIHLDYMEVTNTSSGVQATKLFSSVMSDKVIWETLFHSLLNWSKDERPDLKEISDPISKKLSKCNSCYFQELKRYFGRHY